MGKDYEVFEVTKDNEKDYLQEIVNLENLVLEKMEKEGKIGQLFTTGEEGISEYINSKSNHVFIATKNNDNKTISAAYITQGQIPFTYNDITKYFKSNDNYQEYVKSKYSEQEYKKMIREVYIRKICAFKYARDIILNKNKLLDLTQLSEDEKNEYFLKTVEDEYNNPYNKFHEKSEIRDDLNKYMSVYMKNVYDDMKRYEQLYWIDFIKLQQELGKNKQCKELQEKSGEDKEVEVNKFDSTMKAYDKILSFQKYKIYDISHCKDMRKYYEANTNNTIELDTYITHPDNREKGIARILTFEGIKKSLERVLSKKENEKIFLVSTLHQENFSSKYVSEFFGLEDYIFVNRRNGRDRQVHIFGMDREQVPEYLEEMEKKIAVLYDYNPNNIEISYEEKNDILDEQIKYETKELQNLEKIIKAKSFDSEQRFTGKKLQNFESLISVKKNKIKTFRQKQDELLKEESNKRKSNIGGFKSDNFDFSSDNDEPEL